MQFEIYLVKAGLISAETFVRALDRQLSKRPLFGEVAIKSRRLTIKQVFSILSEQATTEMPFGQVAVQLGMLDQADVNELLAEQERQMPSLSQILLEEELIDVATLEAARRKFREEYRNDKSLIFDDTPISPQGEAVTRKSSSQASTTSGKPSATGTPRKAATKARKSRTASTETTRK